MQTHASEDLSTVERRRQKLRAALSAFKHGAPKDTAEAARLLLSPFVDHEGQELPTPPDGSTPYLLFSLGDGRYAVDVAVVREVTSLTAVDGAYPLPYAPGWLLGVANHRGDLLPVVDLRLLVGLEPASRPSLVVVHVTSGGDGGTGLHRDRDNRGDGEMALGLLVDHLRGIAHLVPGQILAPPPAGGGTHNALAAALSGIVPLAGNSLQVLDLKRLLASPAFRHYDGV